MRPSAQVQVKPYALTDVVAVIECSPVEVIKRVAQVGRLLAGRATVWVLAPLVFLVLLLHGRHLNGDDKRLTPVHVYAHRRQAPISLGHGVADQDELLSMRGIVWVP